MGEARGVIQTRFRATILFELMSNSTPDRRRSAGGRTGGGGRMPGGRSSRSPGSAGRGGRNSPAWQQGGHEEHASPHYVKAGLAVRRCERLCSFVFMRSCKVASSDLFGAQNGELFKGPIRINAHRRHQAYVTLPGLARNVLFEGHAAQNRSVLILRIEY